MQVIYAQNWPAYNGGPAIFLAGPTPRKENPVASWRPEAIKILEAKGFKGRVFVPEDVDGLIKGDYYSQVVWEREALQQSHAIVFWVPRDLLSLPGFTTNVEFGYWVARDPYKIVLGHPVDAPHTKYLDWLLETELQDKKFNSISIFETLEATLDAAIDKSCKYFGFRKDDRQYR